MKNIFYYIILSILAIIMLLVLVFFSSSNINTIGIYDKLFVGGVFITSCLFGISLAVNPGWIKRIMNPRNQGKIRQQAQKPMRKRRGHHPDCNQFQNHTLRIKNKTLCAGCFGLSIGSLISIFLMLSYIIIAGEQPLPISHFLIFPGLIMVGLAHVEILSPDKFHDATRPQDPVGQGHFRRNSHRRLTRRLLVPVRPGGWARRPECQ